LSPYLLPGPLVECMSGLSAPKQNWWAYRCGGRYGAGIGMKSCQASDVGGRATESLIWERVLAFLGNPEVFTAEMERRHEGQTMNREGIEQHLAGQDWRNTRLDSMDTELVAMKLRDEIDEEVYKRNQALNRAERVHIAEEIDPQRALLATVEDNQAAVARLVAMREQLVARLESATWEDQRWVMQMLDVRVTATDIGFTVSLRVPAQVAATVPGKGESEASFLSCRP